MIPTARDLLTGDFLRVTSESWPKDYQAEVEAKPGLTFGVFEGESFLGLVDAPDVRVAPERRFADFFPAVPSPPIPDSTALAEILDEMDRRGVNVLPVMEANGRFAGIVSRSRVNRFLLGEAEKRQRETEVLSALVAETGERLKKNETLLSVSQLFSLDLPRQEALRRVAREVARAFQADMVGAYFLDARKEALAPVAGYHVPKALIETLLATPFPIARFALLQEALDTHRPVWTSDAMSDPRLDYELLGAIRPGSVLFAPTLVRGEFIGGLFLIWWSPGRAFGPAEIRLVEAVASQVGLALQNADLAARTQEKLRETETLLGLSRALTSTLEIQPLLRHFLRQVARTLGAESVGVWLVDPATGWLEPFAGYRVPPRLLDALRRYRIKPEEGPFYAEGISRRRAQVSSEVLGDSRIPASLREVIPHRTQLFVPIVARDRVVAGFIAVWWEQAREFSEGELALVEAMGSQAGVVLENARLYQESERQRRRLATLVDVAQRLTRGLDLPTVLSSIAEAASLVFEGEAGFRLLEGEVLVRVGATPGAREAMAREQIRVGESLSGQVAASGQALVTTDSATDPRLIPEHRASVRPDRTGALMCVPIRVGERVLGTLHVFRERGYRFDRDALGLATSLADQAGIAIENARLYDETRRQHQEAAALGEAARELTSSLDRDDVLQRIVDRARALSGSHLAFLAPCDRGADTATIVAVSGARTEALTGLTVVRGRGAGGRVLETGEPFDTEDYLHDPRITRDYAEAAIQEGVVSEAVVPLRFGGVITGLLGLDTRAPRRFTARDVSLLTTLADHAAIALENSRLYGGLRMALEAAEASQQRIVQTERLRALGQMAGGVAHDFNNALAVVLGRVQLLLQQTEDPAVRRQLQVVEKVALDAARTVKRIQEFARMRRARPLQKVDLNQVVVEVVEVTRSRWKDDAQARGIRYDVLAEPAPVPPVVGDPSELREALTNIVFNALDAMPAGGRVTCRTAVEDTRVLCVVTDTGIGMPEDVRRRVFEPFFSTKEERGSGLGLSMVYGIVTRHGGEIDVQSQVGHGSTFTIRLPVAREIPEAPDRPAAPRVHHCQKILVIDDDQEVRDVLAELLVSQGHAVTGCADGRSGLARLQGEAFDLVFTDLGMPGLSGWEVARLVKAQAPNVPVALVTGWSDQIDPAEAQAKGVDFVVAKPFVPDDVADVVARVLAAASLGRASAQRLDA